MNKHTPGPWSVEPRCHCYAITCTPTRTYEWPEVVFVEMHAQQDGGSITARARTDDELAANANLIAAAPDLLVSLELALPYVEDCPDHGEYSSGSTPWLVQTIKAAIAKAKGGAA